MNPTSGIAKKKQKKTRQQLHVIPTKRDNLLVRHTVYLLQQQKNVEQFYSWLGL